MHIHICDGLKFAHGFVGRPNESLRKSWGGDFERVYPLIRKHSKDVGKNHGWSPPCSSSLISHNAQNLYLDILKTCLEIANGNGLEIVWTCLNIAQQWLGKSRDIWTKQRSWAWTWPAWGTSRAPSSAWASFLGKSSNKPMSWTHWETTQNRIYTHFKFC